MGLPDKSIRFKGGNRLQRGRFGLSVHYERKGFTAVRYRKEGLFMFILKGLGVNALLLAD